MSRFSVIDPTSIGASLFQGMSSSTPTPSTSSGSGWFAPEVIPQTISMPQSGVPLKIQQTAARNAQNLVSTGKNIVSAYPSYIAAANATRTPSGTDLVTGTPEQKKVAEQKLFNLAGGFIGSTNPFEGFSAAEKAGARTIGDSLLPVVQNAGTKIETAIMDMVNAVTPHSATSVLMNLGMSPETAIKIAPAIAQASTPKDVVSVLRTVSPTSSRFEIMPNTQTNVLNPSGLGSSIEGKNLVTPEQLVKHFAEEKNPAVIADTLTKTGLDPARAADLAPKLANATTEQGVKDILTGQKVTIPSSAVDKVAEAKATAPEYNFQIKKLPISGRGALRSTEPYYAVWTDGPAKGRPVGASGVTEADLLDQIQRLNQDTRLGAKMPTEAKAATPITKPLFNSTAEKMATPFETVNAKATDAMPPEEVLPTVKEDGLPLPPETKNKVSFPITGTTEKEMVQSAIANSERAKTMLNVTGKDAYAASRALSPEDLKLAEKYDQGVPISELAPQATNPTKFAAFMDKLTNYYDLRLAADRASGGDTGFVSSYIPHEWDLTKPTDLEKFNQYAKQKGIAPYNGFRAQPRVFGSYAEGEAKGFTRANANIAEDLKSDYQKASSVISKQVLREGIKTAAPDSVSLSGFGRTVKGAPFINSNIKGLGGMSYAPEVSNLLKGFEPLTNQDFIQMAKEDAKTAGGGFKNLAKALPKSGKEAGLGNVLGTLYDHANQPLKHIILNLSGFHSINISGSFAGASMFHPVSGAKGLVLSVPSFFSEKVTQAVIDSFKGKMLGDTGISSFDGMMQIGVNLDRGIAKQAGSVFTHPLKSLSAAMFDRELYTLKLNLGDQVVGDLVKKGIPLDSPTARAYGNEVNLIMGEMNGRISNINPNTQKWLTRALLAPGFTESKYAVLAHSLTRGKASAGNFARTAVIGKSLVIGTLATLGTLLATGKFPNLHQLLLNYSVNPSSQTNIRNPKGQLKDVGFPKTYIDEPLGMIQDPGSYFRARFAPALTNIYESLPPSVLGTGKNYFGQPIVNPKSKTPGWLQTVSNIGIGDLPIGLQNLIGLEQKELTMPEAAIGVAGLSTHLRAKGTNTGGPRFQVQ